MPYPNNNPYNIVIAQTSGSSINGQYPFIERIISGSNLFLATDSNGLLTASSVSPTSSVAISASYALSASYSSTSSYALNVLSASYSKTASYLTPTNNYTVNQLTASNGISSSNDSFFYGNVTINGGDILTTDNNFGIAHNYSGVNKVSIGYFPTGTADGSIVELSNIKTYGKVVVSGSSTSAIGSDTGSMLPDVYFTSSTISGSDLMFKIDVSNKTGSSHALVINAFSMSSGSAYAISASNGIIAGTIISGSDVFFNNATVTGNIIGTVQSSSLSLSSSISSINDNSTYYVTFVDNVSGSRPLKTDVDILSYNPANNRLTLGNTSGSLLISNDNGTNPNYIYLSSEQNAAGGLAQLQVGNPTSNTTSSFVVGQNQFIVATGQPNTGVFTSLVTKITNTTNNNGLTYNNGALIVDGGVGIGKNLFVEGSTFLYGDLTIYGTGSIVNISSSTVIIGDNRIQLNAGTPIQRYAGIDVFDSGSGTFVNSVTSSLLWDGLNDNWLLVSNNKPSGSTNLTQSSAIMIGGPSGSFGNESLLTTNYIPKIQNTGKNLQNSSLSDDGTTLMYSGNNISASNISTSNLTVQYTGSITYATGVYITYTTGSFTTITITTGSNPGIGSQVPLSPTSSGMPGQINVDNNFIYVYTNQVWKRVPLSTWLN